MRKTLCLGSALLVLGWGQIGSANPRSQGLASQTLIKAEAPASTDESQPELSTPDPVSQELPQVEQNSELQSPPAPPPSDVPASEPVVPEPSATDASMQEIPKIDLLNRGEKPRKKLRFKAKVGEKLRSRMIMSSETMISINDEPFPSIPIPDVETVSESEIIKVERDGTTHVRFRYLEPIVKVAEDDPFASMFESLFKEQFKALTNATVTYMYDKRGRLIESELETDIDSEDPSLNFLKQLMQSSQQSSGIFPKKKVGVGAEWSAPQSVSLQGKTLTQDVVYKLLEIQDDQVKIGTQVNIDSPEFMEQVANLLPMTQNIPMTVESFEMSMQGDMTMGFSQFMATNMDMQTDGRAVITLPLNDKEMKIAVSLISTIKMSPEEMADAE